MTVLRTHLQKNMADFMVHHSNLSLAFGKKKPNNFKALKMQKNQTVYLLLTSSSLTHVFIHRAIPRRPSLHRNHKNLFQFSGSCNINTSSIKCLERWIWLDNVLPQRRWHCEILAKIFKKNHLHSVHKSYTWLFSTENKGRCLDV